jgi:hypothetical protein
MKRFWRWLNEPIPPWEDRHAPQGVPLEEFPPPPQEWMAGYDADETRLEETGRERPDMTRREV